MNFGALSRGFGTCCLRFKNDVATIHAKLASGWLAGLYREGVEPSGSLQKVSDHTLVLLFWIYPGARVLRTHPRPGRHCGRIRPRGRGLFSSLLTLARICRVSDETIRVAAC